MIKCLRQVNLDYVSVTGERVEAEDMRQGRQRKERRAQVRSEGRIVQNEGALCAGFGHEKNWTEIRATDCLFDVSGS